MKIILDKIELYISKKLFGKVKIEFNGQTILINDKKVRVVDTIKYNYEKGNLIMNIEGNINSISVKILIHYLDQYSRWKEQYTKSNYDITFYEKDFDHPNTNDIIILYLKEKHPNNWKTISEKYINMTTKEFDSYWTNRLAYFNK